MGQKYGRANSDDQVEAVQPRAMSRHSLVNSVVSSFAKLLSHVYMDSLDTLQQLQQAFLRYSRAPIAGPSGIDSGSDVPASRTT